MSIRWLNYSPGTLAALGLLLGVFLAAPACLGSGAVTIVQDKDQLAPRGSYIPERRVKAVLQKIKALKATMEKNKVLQEQQQQQENKSPKPQSSTVPSSSP
jgi:hypothetical protein